MAKWIIVEISTLKVASSYSSEEPKQFGGPWSDPNKFMHMKVPVELENANAWTVSYESTVTDTIYTPCKCHKGNLVFKEAYDRDGNLMISPNGSPLYAQLFQKLDVYAMAYIIRAE